MSPSGSSECLPTTQIDETLVDEHPDHWIGCMVNAADARLRAIGCTCVVGSDEWQAIAAHKAVAR